MKRQPRSQAPTPKPQKGVIFCTPEYHPDPAAMTKALLLVLQGRAVPPAESPPREDER